MYPQSCFECSAVKSSLRLLDFKSCTADQPDTATATAQKVGSAVHVSKRGQKHRGGLGNGRVANHEERRTIGGRSRGRKRL